MNLETWKVKHLKKAREKGITITDKELLDIYVKDCLKDNIELSHDEMMYEFFKKYCKEISPFIVANYICPDCLESIGVTFYDEDLNLKPKQIENIEFEFDGNKYLLVLDDLINDNFVSCVKNVFINCDLIENFDDLDTFLDTLPIPLYNEIMDKFNNMKSKFVCHKEHTCPLCNTVTDVNLNSIPENIRSELC